MKLPLVLRPEADQDLRLTREWYDRQLLGLGDKFAAQADAAFGQLAVMPELFAAHWGNVRLCRVRRFPYVVYYRITTDRVEVLAVLHTSRDPSAWQSRA